MESRPEEMRRPGINSGVVPEGKEDVMIGFSQAPPRTRSPLARSHLRSRSLAGIPGMPSMTRAYSSPGLDSQGRYIFVNGRGAPVDAKRYPLQMRPDDYIDRMGSLNISETISENAELETIPKSPSQSASPILMPQTFPRIGRLRPTSPLPFQTPISPSLHSSPILGSKYNESYPGQSGSVSSISVPSTPTSLRSRSPSISSLETIPDIPDAENEALEEERIAQLKAAADAADAATTANRRRGASDVPGSFTTMRGDQADIQFGATSASDGVSVVPSDGRISIWRPSGKTEECFPSPIPESIRSPRLVYYNQAPLVLPNLSRGGVDLHYFFYRLSFTRWCFAPFSDFP